MSNLVTLDHAMQLKKFGFDRLPENLTVDGALDWIREKDNVRIKFYVECHYSCALRNVAYQGIITNNAALIIRQRTEEYLSHRLASSELLTAVLNHLNSAK